MDSVLQVDLVRLGCRHTAQKPPLFAVARLLRLISLLMLDPTRLARLVHEEARALAIQISRHDESSGSADNLASELSRLPLPEQKPLARVLGEVFWASTLVEEGRPCRPRLLFLPSGDRARAAHWLTRPIPLTRESIRKLSPAHGPLGYLTWSLNAQSAYVTGIQTRQGDEADDLVVVAPAAGALDVSWFAFRILTMRDGKVHGLSKRALPDPRDAYDLVGDVLGAFEPLFLNATVRAIVEHAHGGSVWLVREGRTLHTLRMEQRIEHDPRGLMERFPSEEARNQWLVSIAYLAGTDGAVVLDSRFRLLGFGVFIPSKPVRIVRRLHNGKRETISSTQLGGGRHRSAAQFCARYAPAAAIVVSVDGRVSVIAATSSEQPPWCAEVVSLGFANEV